VVGHLVHEELEEGVFVLIHVIVKLSIWNFRAKKPEQTEDKIAVVEQHVPSTRNTFSRTEPQNAVAHCSVSLLFATRVPARPFSVCSRSRRKPLLHFLRGRSLNDDIQVRGITGPHNPPSHY
jgi:hypothetical protein